MSPTSYQTAPPRISIIQTCEHPVKRTESRGSVSRLFADRSRDGSSSGPSVAMHSREPSWPPKSFFLLGQRQHGLWVPSSEGIANRKDGPAQNSNAGLLACGDRLSACRTSAATGNQTTRL